MKTTIKKVQNQDKKTKFKVIPLKQNTNNFRFSVSMINQNKDFYQPRILVYDHFNY